MSRLIFAAPKPSRNSIRALLCALETERKLPGKLKVVVARSHRAALEKTGSGDVLLLSSMSTQREEVLDVARIARKKGAFVVAGGPDPSFLYELWLQFVDAVCVGEGEEGIKRFLLALSEGEKPEAASEAAGFATPSNAPSIHHTDLAEVPAVSTSFKMFGPVELTRSCPNACAFCQTPRLFGPVRHRPLEAVLEACCKMVARNMYDLRFIAPNALGYPHWRQLLERLQPLRRKGVRVFFGSFPSEVRPESLTEENIKLLKRFCDNMRLVVGVQSGSNRTLMRLERGHTVEAAIEGVERAIEAGFRVDVDFIFGFPEEIEPEEELAVSLSVAERLAEMGVRIHGHWFLPLPGTPLWGMRPHEPSPALERRIRRLLGRAGFGQWQKQRLLASKLPVFPARNSYS